MTPNGLNAVNLWPILAPSLGELFDRLLDKAPEWLAATKDPENRLVWLERRAARKRTVLKGVELASVVGL